MPALLGEGPLISQAWRCAVAFEMLGGEKPDVILPANALHQLLSLCPRVPGAAPGSIAECEQNRQLVDSGTAGMLHWDLGRFINGWIPGRGSYERACAPCHSPARAAR
jgi:hypothetical protein